MIPTSLAAELWGGQNYEERLTPIEVEKGLVKVFSEDEYKEKSYAVLGRIDEIHNEFSRFVTE